MGGLLVRRAVRRSLAQVRHVTAVPPGSAAPAVERVYAQVERDFGFLAPPVALHSPAPVPLAACWTMLRETLLAAGQADRAVKEAVAASVSVANACPYCVDVHSGALHGLVQGGDALSIAADRTDAVSDPVLRKAAEWARTSADRQAAQRWATPFPAAQLPELVGVAVTFHYLNRMVNIFLRDTPLPFAVPAAARAATRRVLGLMMRSTTGRPVRPGGSLELLPAARLPDDLGWASASPTISAGFAQAAAAIDAAGRAVVVPAVRDLVSSRLAGWDGRAAGLSRAWADRAVAGLPEAQRPAGRLALLTAIASYQVDPGLVAELRRHQPGDEALVALTSWASLAAARQVGGWLWAGLRGAARSAEPASGDERGARVD